MEKLLLVVPSLATGGQEKAAVDTARALSSSYEVKIVLFHRHEVEYESPAEILDLNVPASKGPIGKVFGQIRRILRLRKIRKREKPLAVYSFGESANLANVASGITSPGKSIVSIHGFSSVYRSAVNRFVFRRSDRIVCISRAMRDALLACYPDLTHTVTVENGYDLAAIEKNAREPAEVPKGSPLFVAMGRMEEVKGFDRLLTAFSAVWKAHPEARLLMIGDGSLTESLRETAAQLGISGAVTFAGYQKNPQSFLAKADAFVLSSHNEGFPNALVESLACGLAAVCVDCESGPREILSPENMQPVRGVREATFGILTEQSSDRETAASFLAEGMLRLAEDPDALARYRKTATERAGEFSVEVYAEKLKKLFAEEGRV